MTFLGQLWTYFGVVGIGSLLFWGAALALAGHGCWRGLARRTFWVWLALGLALGGYGAARLNSRLVSNIGIDRSEEEAAMREAQRRQAERRDREARRQILFAEESVQDIVNPADPGQQDKPAQTTEPPPDPSAVPLYRRQGRQEREAGRQETIGDLAQAVEKVEAATAASPSRLLPESDKMRADSWDRVNLLLARWTLVLVAGVALWDYLRRFNRTTGAFLPLPLSAPWIDYVSPKRLAVKLAAPSEVLADALRDFARRGESFLYYGPHDPLPEALLIRLGPRSGPAAQWIRRTASGIFELPLAQVHGRETVAAPAFALPAGPTLANSGVLLMHGAQRLLLRVLRRLPVVVAALLALMLPMPIFFHAGSYYLPHYVVLLMLAPWPLLIWDIPRGEPLLAKLRVSPTTARQAPFYFDAAWFGRACVVCTDTDLAAAQLRELLSFLKARNRLYARTHQTLNVVWAFPELPTGVELAELLARCRQANVRFVRVTQQPEPTDDLYDEHLHLPASASAPDPGT